MTNARNCIDKSFFVDGIESGQVSAFEVSERLHRLARLKARTIERRGRSQSNFQISAASQYRSQITIILGLDSLLDHFQLRGHQVGNRCDVQHAVRCAIRDADTPDGDIAKEGDSHILTSERREQGKSVFVILDDLRPFKENEFTFDRSAIERFIREKIEID